ncbi:MAG: hypothetical protein KME30_20840 [Iphinoe sp. HA4291-MV1]|nr:hypothetical protein [Iphinoe sp. HA4291-MV1]
MVRLVIRLLALIRSFCVLLCASASLRETKNIYTEVLLYAVERSLYAKSASDAWRQNASSECDAPFLRNATRTGAAKGDRNF